MRTFYYYTPSILLEYHKQGFLYNNKYACDTESTTFIDESYKRMPYYKLVQYRKKLQTYNLYT